MDFLRKVKLGRSGIEVTEFCFGTLTMSRIQANLSPESMVPVFQRALELGVNFFDTAHRYFTYDHVRLGLGREIKKVVIASKTGARDLTEAKNEIDSCFRDLKRDMIDIYLLHQVDSEEEFLYRRPVLDHLLELKRQGKVRAVGLSSHKIAGNLSAVKYAGELDILFPVINKKGLGIIDGTVEDGLRTIRQARDAGLGVYAMKPLAGGHLRHDVPAAINFLRQNDAIDAIAVGVKAVDEVEVNVAVFSDGKFPLDREKAGRIIAADRRTIVNFLCKRCGACLEHCDQHAISLGEKKAEINEEKCILCGYCAPHCPQFAIRVI
jgi:aryl-alcohol dehydrogenase-like predicted oxidoreductase